jgi:wyosine [tRNA(Phe)-imidazoG37] synthetase (radical SAM superfamily)
VKWVYGPVPSRRLGQSLGIDPIPSKTCDWNCVYCQLGRTPRLTFERREFWPPEEIVDEVRSMLDAPHSRIDWITLIGSGEPTLHSGLGEMIRRVKALTDIPVAVITNGSLLWREDVRSELLAADAVLPSLDAGSEGLYLRINRPYREASYSRLILGLQAFRHEYRGKLWLEVMLVKGLNDGLADLQDLANVQQQLRPDAIHLNVPTRPPAEAWVRHTNPEGLDRARRILGSSAVTFGPSSDDFDLGSDLSTAEALLAVITRHPMSEEELEAAFRHRNSQQATCALARLVAEGRVHPVIRHGKRFWTAASGTYAIASAGPSERDEEHGRSSPTASLPS